MCMFVSWVEKGERVYFLTREQIDSPLGETIKLRFPGVDELIGHAAIRAYYEIREGVGEDVEYTDFSTPNNFPSVIVQAIKAGKFRGFATPNGLLSTQASVKYAKICQQAGAEYDKICQEAKVECDKICQEAKVEYDKICQQAWPKYAKICQQARTEYAKICQQAGAEYDKICQQAGAEYDKICQQAGAEYDKICQQANVECEKICQAKFWDLFAIPKNRAKAWR